MEYLKLTTSEVPIKIDAVEQHFGATFVGDFCLRAASGEYANFPAAVFWVEKPSNPEHTNYFALYFNVNGNLMITNGVPAVDQPIVGIRADDGEVVYSSYRWDYRTSKDGSVWIDGGRDYVRAPTTSTDRLVRLIVNGPNIEVHPYE